MNGQRAHATVKSTQISEPRISSDVLKSLNYKAGKFSSTLFEREISQHFQSHKFHSETILMCPFMFQKKSQHINWVSLGVQTLKKQDI